MKMIFILILLLFAFTSVSQNITGIYKYDYIRKYDLQNVFLEINILNDSVYIINGFENSKHDSILLKKTEKFGKIKKLKNNNYIFSEYDIVAKKYLNNNVKINKRKIIFYGYKTNKTNKSNKLVKAFELKKVRIRN